MADLASRVCAWHFAPSGRVEQRNTIFRFVDNLDEPSLLVLLSTGCLPTNSSTDKTPIPFSVPFCDLVHDDRGETLLHRLFLSGCAKPCASVERLCTLLVARGLCINARDLLGRTPLHALVLSSWGGSIGLHRLVEVLLQLGADPEACDAGGTKASAFLKEKMNAERQAQSAGPDSEKRDIFFMLQAEQLAATLLLTAPPALLRGVAAGAPAAATTPSPGTAAGGSHGAISSPVNSHPGIFLSRTQVPYAVLFVACDGAATPRTVIKVSYLPMVESKGKILDALEGCVDPTSGYRAACALGPMMGPLGIATARTLVAVWQKTALEAAFAVGARSKREVSACLANCHSHVAGASGRGSSSSSAGLESLEEGASCPYPGECEFHAVATAFAICKPVAPLRYSGAGEKWKQWHEKAQQTLACHPSLGELRMPPVSLTPILSAFGEQLRKYGRRDIPPPSEPPMGSLIEEVSLAGLTAELSAKIRGGAGFVGMGSPTRVQPMALGSSGSSRATAAEREEHHGGAAKGVEGTTNECNAVDAALVEPLRKLTF